jgi:hypothetical protein
MTDITNTDIVADQLKIKSGKVTESSSAIDDAIISSKTADSKTPKKPALTPVANGVIGSGKADLSKKEKSVPTKKAEDKLALFSTKNVYWDGYGYLNRGYNIVSKTKAEAWLTRSHVRLATPEEVANAFGK